MRAIFNFCLKCMNVLLLQNLVERFENISMHLQILDLRHQDACNAQLLIRGLCFSDGIDQVLKTNSDELLWHKGDASPVYRIQGINSEHIKKVGIGITGDVVVLFARWMKRHREQKIAHL